jgi:hypothetical protein
MTPHDIALHWIEREIRKIPTSIMPTNVAECACAAAYLSCDLGAITAQERDELVARIRAAEIPRYLELLEKAA